MGDSALVDRIHAELHSVNKPDIRLGEFNPKADITKLDISALAKQV